MEELAITFNDAPAWASQQTIVKILKQVKYKFEPINEYENNLFYCITQQKDHDPLKNSFKKFGFKVKDKFFSCPLAITVCGFYNGLPVVEPIVFTRNDVLNIISDVPENYIGPDEL